MSGGISAEELAALVRYADNLKLAFDKEIDEEPLYHSLPLCVTDAVYSINARYQSTRMVVERLAEYARYPLLRESSGDEPTLSDFLALFDELGAERMADEVFRNRQRTSTTNGILKAEAVRQFARALRDNGIERRADAAAADPVALKRDILAIPGQRSGISLRYFFMLTGDYSQVKPDRHIMNFVSAAIGRTLDVPTCHAAIVAACAELQKRHPHLTPRTFDARIWHFQRLSGEK